MKKTLIKTEIIENYIIDYENGIFCEYITTNGVLSYYIFKNKNNLRYITKEEIEILTNQIWSERVFPENTFTSVEELESFTMFDDLYYRKDETIIYKHNGIPLSAPILLDSIFFSIYEKIETKKEKCEAYISNMKQEFILSSKIEEIPYYNQDEKKNHHFTVKMIVKLPQNVFEEIYKKSNNGYISDNFKKETVKFLKIN